MKKPKSHVLWHQEVEKGRPTDGAWEDFCQSVATQIDENDAAQLWQMLAYTKRLESERVERPWLRIGELEDERDQLRAQLAEWEQRHKNLRDVDLAAINELRAQLAKRDEGERQLKVGGPLHVEFWDAVNAYVVACGGKERSLGIARHKAVVRVDDALRRVLSGAGSEGSK